MFGCKTTSPSAFLSLCSCVLTGADRNLIGFAASADPRLRSYFVVEVVRCAFSYGCYQMEVFQGRSIPFSTVLSFLSSPPRLLWLIFCVQLCSRIFSISATPSLAARWLWRALLRGNGWGCFDFEPVLVCKGLVPEGEWKDTGMIPE